MISARKISYISFVRFIFIFVLFISQNSFSQSSAINNVKSKDEEWRLRKDENGIRIFSRRLPGEDIDELRVISMMHASLSSIVAVMMDANHFTDWIYACEESKILQQISSTEQYQYQLIDLPSPFSDRDAVIHFTIKQDSTTKIVSTRSLAAPDFIPAKNGLVRLPVFDGAYQLIPKGNGDVQVIYSLRTEPGGYIPDWLVNWTIVTGHINQL